jgi:hypothetical protein
MVRSVWPDSSPHWNVTRYTAPGLASQSTVAVADDWPLGIVTVSKTPEETLVSLAAVDRQRDLAARRDGRGRDV